MNQKSAQVPLTPYHKLVIALLAIIQFTVVLDFMVMAPLGDLLMKNMHLGASQFASAVSVYAFAAGGSGILAAGFADKYDRKKLLLIFYIGFILGTLMCGTATTFGYLLAGRVVTGLFAGVLGSVSMAIIADLFHFSQRGRVMGFVQMSFAVSQIAGIPVGLYLANKFDWHAPFMMIVVLALVTAVFIFSSLRPVTVHMEKKKKVHPLVHLQKTISNPQYWLPFVVTAMLSLGAFMMMPFSTPFLINNIGVSQKDLPMIYLIIGTCSLIIMPIIGKLSDKAGKLPMFFFGTVVSLIMVAVYVNLGRVPLWQVILVNAIMFTGIMSRMVPSTALMTAIPNMEDRGAFMSINSSLQQISGGVASVLAGFIVVQQSNGQLAHFDTVGYICMGFMLTCAVLMYTINKRVMEKLQGPVAAAPVPEIA
jgi:predicted MFS family arabinose efflux permease